MMVFLKSVLDKFGNEFGLYVGQAVSCEELRLETGHT